jgi:Spy/CpxP family protein refolding chaperone
VTRMAKFLLITARCPAVVCAQGRRGGFHAGFGGRGRARGRAGYSEMDEQTALDLVTALLNLTDMQRKQVGAIFDAAGKAAAPIAAQIQSPEDSLFDAVTTGKSDDEIKAIATKQESLRTQILILQAETFAKVWALLRNDQKTQVYSFVYDDIGQFLSNPTPPVPLPSLMPSATTPSAPSPAAP